MTQEEIKRGIDLYNKMTIEHYGSLHYKSARDRYRKFKSEMAEKYNVESIRIHNDILSNRQIDKGGEER